MSELNERVSRIQHLNIGLLGASLLIALSLAFWGVVRSQAFAQRQDNPRTVEEELRIRRGRILDAGGVVLAETIGPQEAPQRLYSIPNIGPAVGYYSFRHGTAGVEEGYDDVLRGDSTDVWETFWRQNLHEAQAGRDIRLTLNSDWQRTADSLMEGHDGAVVLLSLPEGAIRVMVSHPSYDPNRLDEQFEALSADEEAPLLNRATQGRYQPGLTLQPFLLAAAADASVLTLADAAPGAKETVTVHGQATGCRDEPPPTPTWADVLKGACPGPMLTLEDDVSEQAYIDALRRLGLYEAPELPLATAAPAEEVVEELQAALVGQDTLTVTPLQMALAWSALGNSGIVPRPELVAEVQDESGAWSAAAGENSDGQPAISGEVAWSILSALPRHDDLIAEYATAVLSGPEGSTNSWYLGMAPASTPRYAVVVVVEDTDQVQTPQQIGRSLLNFVLENPNE